MTEPTRREFLWTGAAGVGGTWLASLLPAIVAAGCEAADSRAGDEPLRVLSPDEAGELEAIAARIVPGDEGDPGAREADVIRFFDRAFETFQAGGERAAREGLSALQARVEEAYPGRGPFSVLAADEQDALLAEIESGAFFQQVRFLTIAGMFAMPARGGNRDGVGWRLIGFEARSAWEPPFGAYDREAHGA